MAATEDAASWRSERLSDTRVVVREALVDFAVAPDAYLSRPPGAQVLDGEQYFASLSGDGQWISVCRLDFDAADAAEVLEEVRALLPTARTGWQTPREDLAEALRAAGCRPPEPPLEPRFTALATDCEPPAVDGVEVRRIETFEEHLAGLEIELASANWPEEAAARRRSEAEVSYTRRKKRPGGQWLAYLDGEPVAWGSAIAGSRGLYLSGGATLPEARGHGCYRALVRARWDEAVARDTPGLVVGAQETSRPILERCGFVKVETMYELETDPC
jgi:GNAT superfamily N-acetyltransferase